MNYEKITRSAYRSRERAASYKRYHTSKLSWGRIATRLEQRIVRRFLQCAHLRASETVLDIPCGTGVLGETLAVFPARVIASDISIEMISLGMNEYIREQFDGFVQADITAIPFPCDRFAAVVALGLMHRIPAEVRGHALSELHRISRRIAVVSFSFTSPAQAAKHRLLQAVTSHHVPAAAAIPRFQAEEEICRAGFRVVECAAVAPFLSAESVFLLEKVASR